MGYDYKVENLWSYIVGIILLLPFVLEAREPVWHPQDPGTPMLEYTTNCDGTHKAAYWAEHAGFTIQIDDSSTFNDLSQAPQVQIDLDEDPIHLQNQDFTIQTRVKLNTPDVDSYFAGLCIHFDDGETIMFGRGGLNSIRLEYKGSLAREQTYSSDVVYVKIKRCSNQYAVWFSEDCQIWTHVATELIEAAPVSAGTVLRNWGAPREVEVEFKHFEIMHVENEPNEFIPNYWYGENPNECLHFIYDLSGIDIVFHVYLRQANDMEPTYQDRKMYYIHASHAEGEPYDPSGGISVFINQNFLHPTDKTGAMNLMLIAPTYFDDPHPYFNHRFQYRSLLGEEDWMLVDLHENYIREHFPATQSEIDDKFYLCGSSAGGQFVNRFCMAHAKKLHAAVTRAAGGVTFPTYEMYWSSGLDTSTWAAERNPRLIPDLESLKELKVASVVGENDNEVYWPNSQPVRYSSYDGMRKWIRQLSLVCGNIVGETFICPFEGHGYGYGSRRLTLNYFFGDEAELEEVSQKKYTFELGPQDEKIPLNAEDVPDEMFYYTRFESWWMPWGFGENCYEFFPGGICHVLDTNGRYQKEASWSVRRIDGELYVVVDGRVYGSPYRQYGKLTLKTEDETFMLEQSAFVTPRFIQDCVIDRTFYVFEGISRYPNGPLAVPTSVYPPFKLQSDGTVVDVQTGLSYSVRTMRRWIFEPERALLKFTDNSEQEDGFLQIGEWRWHITDSGIGLVAGLHTKDAHDDSRFEIRCASYYDPRCFEEWEYTWPTGDHDNTRIIYVDKDSVGSNDGSGWENAFVDLQDALGIARFGDTIRVAQGHYYPASANGSRNMSFTLVDGVFMEGGYAGYGQENPDARNISLYAAVLSGDLMGNDQPGFMGYEDNVYHIVTANNVGSRTVLDGFVVTAGNANGSSSPNDGGGGLRNQDVSLVIKNCTFKENLGSWGAAIEMVDSSAIFENCQFFENEANKGGAIHCYASSPIIKNCLFARNKAKPDGGVIISRRNSIIRINGCTIVDNIATWGPAFLLSDQSNIILTNSIVWQNIRPNIPFSQHDWTYQIEIRDSYIDICYSCVQGITQSQGEGNIGVDPLFIDPQSGNYHLSNRSLCINAGDPNYEPEADERDLDGRPRINNGRIDMGTYEYVSKDNIE